MQGRTHSSSRKNTGSAEQDKSESDLPPQIWSTPNWFCPLKFDLARDRYGLTASPWVPK